MAIATDGQVQAFSDQRYRVRAEMIRNLVVAMQDDINSVDSVYSNLTQQSPTWTDNRTDDPPNLATVANLLALNSIEHDLITAITGNANYTAVLQMCVRPAE
jgi:hypothetical protein